MMQFGNLCRDHTWIGFGKKIWHIITFENNYKIMFQNIRPFKACPRTRRNEEKECEKRPSEIDMG